MRSHRSMGGLFLAGVFAILPVLGACSSHYSEHRYEYDSGAGTANTESREESRRRANEPPRGGSPQTNKGDDSGLTEEYQMVSPGQMVVDPK